MRYAIFVALVTTALTVNANPQTYVIELEQLAAKTDLNELVDRVNQPRNFEELRVGLDWLRAKSISGFGGARITYSYALNLFRAGVKDTATLAYLFGLLTSRIDAARCADPSAPVNKLHYWEQTLSPIFLHFRSLPGHQQRDLVSRAMDMEHGLRTRAADAWMCSGGLSFMQKFSEKHKDNPNPPTREIQDPTGKRRTVVMDDPDIKPDFVPDEQWTTRRNEIIVKFLQSPAD